MGTGVIASGGFDLLVGSGYRAAKRGATFGLWLLPRWVFIYWFCGVVGFYGVILRCFLSYSAFLDVRRERIGEGWT